jgi:prepilin-type N-terminal cleavage/methylation domain-containing protein
MAYPEVKKKIWISTTGKLNSGRTEPVIGSRPCRINGFFSPVFAGIIIKRRRYRPFFFQKRTNILQLRPSNGFTLIELIVVISLISMMLFFSMPRFRDAIPLGSDEKAARWIIGKVRSLKESAVREQQDYILNLNLDTNRLWVTTETMTEEELQNAGEKGYSFPSGTKLLDIEFPGNEKITSGKADICFFKKGYCDKVLIHLGDEDGKQLSILVEAFLPWAQLYGTYIEFED